MIYREVAAKLTKLGCEELPRRGGGSHRKWLNPLNDRITVVPDWGNRDLKIGRCSTTRLGLAGIFERITECNLVRRPAPNVDLFVKTQEFNW